jgi:TetR/AcrR family transcriptional regulator, transcriptional repressor for nem operon
MRYPKHHKETVRQQLLQGSAQHAKQYGFSASSADALAGAAGLTTGSLYKHFENKNALFSELLTAELARTMQRYEAVQPGDTQAMQKSLNAYLSSSHAREAATGCPIPSLAAEVSRSSLAVRGSFETGVVELKNTMAALTGSNDTAWALMAQNVGAIMIARAMLSEPVKDEILAAARIAGASLLAQCNDSPTCTPAESLECVDFDSIKQQE